MEVGTTEARFTGSLSLTASRNTGAATGECVRVVPGSPSSRAQSASERGQDGSEFPIDQCRGLLEAALDAMAMPNQGREIVLLNVQAERQC